MPSVLQESDVVDGGGVCLESQSDECPIGLAVERTDIVSGVSF